MKLVLLASLLAFAQSALAEGWYVLETLNPPPASRSDWISVGKLPIDGARVAPGTRIYETFAEAVAAADAYRLSARFESVCDRSYSVWRNIVTNEPVVTSSGSAGMGYILDRPGLCCEDAYAAAFPTPASNDCRTLRLQSVPDALVRITPSGWVSLSGTAVVIATLPPITIPVAASSRPTIAQPAAVSPAGRWRGEHGESLTLQLDGTVLTGTARGGKSHPAAVATLRGSFSGREGRATYSATENHVRGRGEYRFTLESSGHLLVEINGSYWSGAEPKNPHRFQGRVRYARE